MSDVVATVRSNSVVYDYEPLRDPTDAVVSLDVIVAGNLVEIGRGITQIDARVYPSRSEEEVKEALARQDATIARFKADGAGAAVIAELEASRERIMENKPRRTYSEDYYAAFRVQVTEVFKGDVKVGDMLDVQIPIGTLEAIDLLTDQLRCTPRAIVGGGWFNRQTEGVSLQGPDGATVDWLFASAVDLFWLDEGTWEPRDGGEQPVERPAPEPEAFYLRGLDEMAAGWGSLETLDDLADALRKAPRKRTPPPISY